MNSFDYIIVGAGAAACVLANRLARRGRDQGDRVRSSRSWIKRSQTSANSTIPIWNIVFSPNSFELSILRVLYRARNSNRGESHVSVFERNRRSKKNP